MRVLHVVSELYPLVKTGGLADVAAALPPALVAAGAAEGRDIEVRVLLPGYPSVMSAGGAALPAIFGDADLFGGGPATLRYGVLDGVGVGCYVLDSPGLYDRPGNPYVGPDRRDWPDNHRRFAALGWAGARLGQGADDAWRPAILHGHDWQAGLMPAFAAFGGPVRPSTVLTIHNIAYQGWFPAAARAELGLPAEEFAIAGFEYFGGVGFLKAGLWFADKITTVSRTYALEIQTAEHGSALEGLLAGRAGDLVGIVNGIDDAVWDPGHDPLVPVPYGPDDLSGKQAAKAALQRRAGLPEDPSRPLFAVISRLTWHKGLDLLLTAIPDLVKGGGSIVVLGSGEEALEAGYRNLAAAFPSAVAVEIGYDEALSHLIQAGADVLCVPSRAEPCGLTQMYALRYGTLPLVRRTGGLADTVVDASMPDGTGFVFDEPTVADLVEAIGRALALWQEPERWGVLQQRAMAQDNGWGRAARDYLAFYDSLPTHG